MMQAEYRYLAAQGNTPTTVYQIGHGGGKAEGNWINFSRRIDPRPPETSKTPFLKKQTGLWDPFLGPPGETTPEEFSNVGRPPGGPR